MSHLSGYPQRSLAWLTVGPPATVRLLKVVVLVQKKWIFLRWWWLWRRTRKWENDSEHGPRRVRRLHLQVQGPQPVYCPDSAYTSHRWTWLVQMCDTPGRDKDKLLLGMLTALQNEAAVKHYAKLLLVLRVHALHLNTQSRNSLLSNQCSVAFIAWAQQD